MKREKIQRVPELTREEINRYHRVLRELESSDMQEDEVRRVYRDYFPDKPLGRAICESYRQSELTEILMRRAEELGCAPSQNQVFSIYRTYIKRQFRTWPNALRQAGLRYGLQPRSPGIADWPAFLEEDPATGFALLALAERERSLGRFPTQKDAGDGSGALRERFGDWETALGAAHELDIWLEAHPFRLKECDPSAMEELRATARCLERTPLPDELPETTRLTLRAGCGSWNSALQAAGLTPLAPAEKDRALWEFQQRKKAGNCPLLLIRDLDPEQRDLLRALEQLCASMDRTPLRDEVPADLYHRLLHMFGSWRNALFQLGRAPLTKEEAGKLKRKRRGASNGVTMSGNYRKR